MKSEITEELLKFIASKYGTSPIYIAKDIEVNIETPYEFDKSRDYVKGMIVIGDMYPLNGLDVSIEDHIKVMKATQGVTSYGTIVRNHISGNMQYKSSLNDYYGGGLIPFSMLSFK